MTIDYREKIITDIELHSVEGIRSCFEHGVSPNDRYNNRTLLEELISEYTRSPRFKECIKVFVDFGVVFENTALLLVLLDDAQALAKLIAGDPSIPEQRCSFRNAYTPMEDVTLLHVCAEFNHVACAKVLVESGADINAKAGVDEHGFGGQSPVFHTVNQNANHSIDMLRFLVSMPCDLHYTVRGLIWGKGYAWQTFVPSVNPVSYAMMGLLPQMHRDEVEISRVVSLLMKAAWGIDYTPQNVPCGYLRS